MQKPQTESPLPARQPKICPDWGNFPNSTVAKAVESGDGYAVVKKKVCRLAMIFTASALLGQQGLETPRAAQNGEDSVGFYTNPNETKEKKRRAQEYKRLYDEELSDSTLTQNQILRKIFAPRVYEESFDTSLPGRRKSGQWSLEVNPRFSDFFGDSYIRTPLGLRYNWSKNFLTFTEMELYTPNPFEDATRSGMYIWKLGGKYSWMNIRDSHWNLAVGLKARMPVFDPPLELTDAYARYEPYFSISRQLDSHPKWLVYFNVAYQFLEDSPFEAKPIQPQPMDRIFLRPGFIYYPGGHFRYSFELEYRTNALDSSDLEGTSLTEYPAYPVPDGFRRENWILATQTVHEVIANPGITWYPTKKLRDNLIIPGNWDLGIECRIPLVDETGQAFRVNVRFRWYYDYRKLIAKDLPSLFGNHRD